MVETEDKESLFRVYVRERQRVVSRVSREGSVTFRGGGLSPGAGGPGGGDGTGTQK